MRRGHAEIATLLQVHIEQAALPPDPWPTVKQCQAPRSPPHLLRPLRRVTGKRKQSDLLHPLRRVTGKQSA